VRFGQLNLCQPIEDLGPFDVIFLRNVLIYFDAATKQQVVDRVLDRCGRAGCSSSAPPRGARPAASRCRCWRPGPSASRWHDRARN
jgi:chemotaxis protein methyltransferase CheR